MKQIIKSEKLDDYIHINRMQERFKDENGKTIKDFSSVYAITFYSNEEFLISNLLVV